MANSSFSWCGAFLNKKQGTIICPDKWWGYSKPNQSESDIRPPEWIQQKIESDYKVLDE